MLLMMGCLCVIIIAVIAAAAFWFYKSRSSTDISEAAAQAWLDTLRAQHPLSPLHFRDGGSFGKTFHSTNREAFSRHKRSIGLCNQEQQPALLVTALLKNYRPIVGHIVAVFDQHRFHIFIDQHEQLMITLDQHILGSTPYPLLSTGPVDYLRGPDGNMLFWHNRVWARAQLTEVAHLPIPVDKRIDYTIFSDAEKTRPVAHIRRGEGRQIERLMISGDTSIEFVESLPFEEKALILGYLLIDLLFFL